MATRFLSAWGDLNDWELYLLSTGMWNHHFFICMWCLTACLTNREFSKWHWCSSSHSRAEVLRVSLSNGSKSPSKFKQNCYPLTLYNIVYQLHILLLILHNAAWVWVVLLIAFWKIKNQCIILNNATTCSFSPLQHSSDYNPASNSSALKIISSLHKILTFFFVWLKLSSSNFFLSLIKIMSNVILNV